MLGCPQARILELEFRVYKCRVQGYQKPSLLEVANPWGKQLHSVLALLAGEQNRTSFFFV